MAGILLTRREKDLLSSHAARTMLPMLRCCSYDSPPGSLLLAAEGASLVGLWMPGQRYFGEPYGSRLPQPSQPTGILEEACAWLDAYFAGARPSHAALPISPGGTPFQRRVWAALCSIPYGETRSYGELARRLGSSPRAVGGAVGRNPIAIMIPCHRVVGSGNTLGGYAGGVERKRFLLAAELGRIF